MTASDPTVIRVSFVITGLSGDGAERMLYKLLSALDRSRIDPAVVVLADEGDLGASIKALGVPLTAIGLRPGAVSAAALVRVARALAAHRCDIAQGWMYHGNLAASLASAIVPRRIRVVWNIRGTHVNLSAEKFTTASTIWLGARLSRWPARIINNSAVSARDHERLGYSTRRQVIIPNGFDLDAFVPSASARTSLRAQLGLGEPEVLIGLIGRYHPMKDHAGFLLAARRVADREARARFVMAGEGVDVRNAELTSRIAASGLDGRVRLLGRRTDMPRIMAGLDMLALASSYGEGFPNVIGEAMACGVPCVVTDVGDSASIVGPTGRVAAPRDPAALADAMCALIEAGPGGRQALGRAARQRVVDNFSLGAISDRYQALYAEICAPPIDARR